MSDEIPNQSFDLERKAFSEVVALLGAKVMRTILDGAAEARERGTEGAVFSDACEDEPPTVMIAARLDEVEFALGGDPPYILPLNVVETILAETPPVAQISS